MSTFELGRDTFWFYGQLVYTLWFLWLHRNKVIFHKHEPNPQEVIQQQKILMRWTNTVLQENQSNSGMTNHKDQSLNIIFVPTNIGIPIEHSWFLFITIRKRKNVSWYGSNAIIWSNEGDCITLCRSYEAGSKLHSQLLVLREVLLHLKERKIKHITF